jgi:hypothetical protein
LPSFVYAAITPEAAATGVALVFHFLSFHLPTLSVSGDVARRRAQVHFAIHCFFARYTLSLVRAEDIGIGTTWDDVNAKDAG